MERNCEIKCNRIICGNRYAYYHKGHSYQRRLILLFAGLHAVKQSRDRIAVFAVFADIANVLSRMYYGLHYGTTQTSERQSIMTWNLIAIVPLTGIFVWYAIPNVYQTQ